MKSLARVLTLVILFAMTLAFIAGCGASQPQLVGRSSTSKDEAVVEKVVEVQVERETVAGAPAYSEGDRGLTESPASPMESVIARMIVRTGSLSLLVENTEAAMQQIKSIAEGLGGYVANSNAYHSGDLLHGSMAIRVPATQFDSAFAQFKALATRVENENTGADDVTEEYSDLSARLLNLEATEVELRELLATVRQRTGKAEDILAVYRELTEIRGQIEQLKGRMQYLERMTALATIHIELIPNQIQKPIVEPSWNPGLTLRNAFRSLVNAFQFIVEALIWFAVFALPILVVIAIPILIVVWIIRRNVRRKRAQKKDV